MPQPAQWILKGIAMADFTSIIDALVDLNAQDLERSITEALNRGVCADDILEKGLICAMDMVGEKMSKEELFIPEVMKAAKLMRQAIDTLRPLLGDGPRTAKGRVVIGTVKGDLHDIGKDLVALMLKSAGFQVCNLGVDVPAEKFLAAAREPGADIIALSALLTTTLSMMKETIDGFVRAGMRKDVIIIAGGAPVTRQFAEEIGADGFAPDAGSAVKLAKNLMEERHRNG